MRAWSSSSRFRIHLNKQLVPFHEMEVRGRERKITSEKASLRKVKETEFQRNLLSHRKNQSWILVEMKYLVYTDKRSQESS